jgi:hypothetical protein
MFALLATLDPEQKLVRADRWADLERRAAKLHDP